MDQAIAQKTWILRNWSFSYIGFGKSKLNIHWILWFIVIRTYYVRFFSYRNKTTCLEIMIMDRYIIQIMFQDVYNPGHFARAILLTSSEGNTENLSNNPAITSSMIIPCTNTKAIKHGLNTDNLSNFLLFIFHFSKYKII